MLRVFVCLCFGVARFSCWMSIVFGFGKINFHDHVSWFVCMVGAKNACKSVERKKLHSKRLATLISPSILQTLIASELKHVPSNPTLKGMTK